MLIHHYVWIGFYKLNLTSISLGGCCAWTNAEKLKRIAATKFLNATIYSTTQGDPTLQNNNTWVWRGLFHNMSLLNVNHLSFTSCFLASHRPIPIASHWAAREHHSCWASLAAHHLLAGRAELDLLVFETWHPQCPVNGSPGSSNGGTIFLTIFLTIFWGYIPKNIAQKHRPLLYGIGTSNRSRFLLAIDPEPPWDELWVWPMVTHGDSTWGGEWRVAGWWGANDSFGIRPLFEEKNQGAGILRWYGMAGLGMKVDVEQTWANTNRLVGKIDGSHRTLQCAWNQYWRWVGHVT